MDRLQSFINNKDKIFCFDVDDILFATTDKWIKLINEDYECRQILKSKNHFPLKIEHWESWDFIPQLIGDIAFKFHKDNSLYDNFELVPKSKELIDLITKIIGIDRIRFVTASEKNNINIKDKFLVEHFDIPIKSIIHSKEKEEFYTGNFILDDAAHNHINLLDREDTICVMLDYAWNNSFQHKNLNRIHSLDELIIEFQKYHK